MNNISILFGRGTSSYPVTCSCEHEINAQDGSVAGADGVASARGAVHSVSSGHTEAARGLLGAAASGLHHVV